MNRVMAQGGLPRVFAVAAVFLLTGLAVGLSPGRAAVPAAQGCTVTFFTTSPASPVSLGTDVILHGKGTCGAARFEINGQVRAETSAPEQTYTWRAGEAGLGAYTVCFALNVANNWATALRDCRTYQVTEGSINPTAPPIQVGEVNIYGYCISLGYQYARSEPGDAYSWRCVDEEDEDDDNDDRVTGIDMYAVCRWQYNGALPYPGLADRDDPNSWTCNLNQTSLTDSTTGDAPADGSCAILFFTTSPASPVSLGTQVVMHGKGSCGVGRFEVDGIAFGQNGAPEITGAWNTSAAGFGSHSLCFALTATGDWAQAARVCQLYQVTDGSINPANPPLASGRVNVQGYCQSLGYDYSRNVPTDGFSWRCVEEGDDDDDTDDTEVGVDMYAVCRWQYNGLLPYPLLVNRSDANSWVCNRDAEVLSGQPPTAGPALLPTATRAPSSAAQPASPVQPAAATSVPGDWCGADYIGSIFPPGPPASNKAAFLFRVPVGTPATALRVISPTAGSLPELMRFTSYDSQQGEAWALIPATFGNWALTQQFAQQIWAGQAALQYQSAASCP